MPAVMSQAETREKLQAMLGDAYRLMAEDTAESTFGGACPTERRDKRTLARGAIRKQLGLE